VNRLSNSERAFAIPLANGLPAPTQFFWVGNLYDHGVPCVITHDQVVVLILLLYKLNESCINRPLS